MAKMEEGSESSSGSSEESEVEWEDVEPVPSILNAPEPSLEQLEALKASQGDAGPSQSTSKPQAGSLEIVLERKVQGKKKVKDHLEKALAAFNKEVRHNQHKVHLLCLVARGLYLSRQCDDIIRQGLLLSVLGTDRKELVYSNAEAYNENIILKILKWLSNKTPAALHQTLKESMLQDVDCSAFSDAQLLVTLFRALGLRVRLVMVLNPIPFKETKASGKGKPVKGSKKTVATHYEEKDRGEGMELTIESDAPSRKEARLLKESKSTSKRKSMEESEVTAVAVVPDEKESGEEMDLTIEQDAPPTFKKATKSSGKRKREGSREKLQGKLNSGEDDGGGGTSKTTKGTARKKSQQSTDEESSSSHTLDGQAQKGRTKRQSQTTNQQKQRTTSTSSPYFKKQTRRRSVCRSSKEVEEEEGDPGNLEQSTSKRSSGSDSEYLPERDKPKKRNLSASFEEIQGDDDDDDFEPPKKKRRKSSSKLAGATPAKKLKQAADKKAKAETLTKPKTATSRRKSKSTAFSDSKDGDSNQPREDGSNSQAKPMTLEEGKDSSLTAASNSDSNQSRGSPLDPEGVKIVKSEDTAYWAEVYLTVAGHGGKEGGTRGDRGREKGEKETKRWTCVHLPSCSVDQPHLCEKHCTIPLHYVIAIENGCTVRDVTARYASNWCTHGRKQRLSEEWWEESLRPYEPSSVEEREAEEENILSMLYAQPLPTTISDYKNHPLYALRRHLLKFEAIYPEESQILGYCKGEPVYARQCVHNLHTRETWLKEGRVVRIGEKAYKMVKARQKRGQSALDSLQNSTVEVFGRWQTELYMAPPVVNGKVPRNEYGNVEMFLPSMLPPGACHIKIQGISKVARKLDIDYAPAMVGWDFHSGFCHPIMDGIVVAEEYEEVLREAWQQQEQLLIEKDIQKREARVLERWKRLTRCLLIRERVKRTYERVNATS